MVYCRKADNSVCPTQTQVRGTPIRRGTLASWRISARGALAAEVLVKK